MDPSTSAQETARFGPYQLDVGSGEVRKFGTRIRLGEQPLRILVLLIKRPGELVTREELRGQLWSDDTFVDFDHSLNSAVQRLRDVLSDRAQKAQWIETVPRRGYRFVGNVQWTRVESKPNPQVPAPGKDQATDRHVATDWSAALALPRPAPRRFDWRFVSALLVVLLGVGALAKIIFGERAHQASIVIRSLAVLPLQNLSGDSSQEYLADGMTDELITALAKNRSLRVVSRTSAMQYKGARRPIREIASELGVEGILEGSMTRSANRVHMTVQLIYAPTDTHIWAESYDRDFSGAFSLPLELSQTIAKEVKVAVSPAGPQRYINPEAHDAYLRGRYFWVSDNDGPSLEYFKKAIQLQPDYAAAWSGLSDYYGGHAVGGLAPPQELRQNWEADARKAVELDDSLADAHNSMAAWYLFSAWDWKRAEAESLRSIALNPNYAEAYHVYSYTLTVTNRPADAIKIQKLGMEVDPFARPWALGLAYYHLRQFDAAINELRLREEAEPSDVSTHAILSEAYRLSGFEKDAARELEQVYLLQGHKESVAAIRQAFEKGGYKSVAEWQLGQQKARARRQYFSPFWLAMETARIGHKEETIRLLEEAYREHSPRLIFLQCEPVFDFLHSDPSYRAIVKNMGLPPAD
jgi:TolB-like protein/DNA-binding winged helix-turn-helix (wHTH) protein/tetratricopeptide (TPR) repeat protein